MLFRFKILASIDFGVKLIKLTVIVLLSLLTGLISYGQSGVPVTIPKGETPIREISNSPDSTVIDSTTGLTTAVDSTDSLAAPTDTTNNIPISDDAIDEKITFHVPDSAIVLLPTKTYTFYGEDVSISMGDIKLEAPKVIYRQDSSSVYAYSKKDTATGLPQSTFTQGDESFKFGEIKYNFDTKKAMVVDARSQYDEGYIYSDKIKRNPDNTINGLTNVYTTCSAPDPHFSIVSKRIKIIPDRVVVSGPARLEIAGISTPLILPFALFPLSKGQKSGFILPTYDVAPNFGVGLRGMGYYLALSDYMDLKLVGNLYSYGTWLIDVSSAYVKKYRYGGSLSLSTGSTILGDRNTEDYSEDRTFSVDWVHRIDPNIMRGYNFNADVHFVSPKFYRNNSYNNDQFLQNSTNSNIRLTKSWNNRYNFSLNLTHSQNNSTHDVDLTLPSFAFNVTQFAPFQRKVVSSAPKWYEKINISYILNANNNMSFKDSLLRLNDPSTYQLRNAFNHYIPLNANYKILKYLNFTTGINYNEYWNTQKATIHLDTNTNLLDTSIVDGFFASRSIDANVGLSNTVYGLFNFKGKRLKAIRHQLITDVRYVVRPDFTQPQWNAYYLGKLDTASEKEEAIPYYITSLNNNYAGRGNQGSIEFNINNNVEMKRRSKTDTGEYVKSPLIERFILSTNYNFIADSFKLAPLNLSFATRIIKQIQVVADANLSPYAYNKELKREVDEYLWNSSQGGLLRFNSATIRVSGSIDSKMFDKNESEEKSKSPYLYTDYLNQYVDFDIPWAFSVDYLHTISNFYDEEKGEFRIEQNPTIKFDGNFNLTQRWKFVYSLAYDFKKKAINYTRLDIYRDLHCWDLNIGAIPFGLHRSFNITLNVKAAVLQDLRINKRQDFIDNF